MEGDGWFVRVEISAADATAYEIAKKFVRDSAPEGPPEAQNLWITPTDD